MKRISFSIYAIILFFCQAGTLDANTITISGSINSSSEVNQWVFSLANTSDLIVDVQAWESCGKKPIPQDFFGDGNNNNKLNANIYLFTMEGLLEESSTGTFPGDSAPGAHQTRSGRNPYLSITDLSAGTYILVIGAYPLSQTDAWNSVNNDGSSWIDNEDPNNPNYYNIIITASTDDLNLQYYLTVDIIGFGEVALTPPGETHNKGSELTLEAMPNLGWGFSGWSGDLTGSNNPATIAGQR